MESGDLSPGGDGHVLPPDVSADVPPALMVESGPDAGATVPLAGETTTLGRHVNCDVVVDGAAVSRLHAGIEQAETGYLLRDYGSTNGTFVNDQKIDEQGRQLVHGDEVRLGGSDVQLVFLHPGAKTVELPLEETRAQAVRVDAKARQTYIDNEILDPPLTRKEFDLLMLLDSKRGEAVNRDEIGGVVWSERLDGDVGTHEIEQCVHRVRLRIEADPSTPEHLLTVRGFGYKLI